MSVTGKFFIMMYSQSGNHVMPMLIGYEDDVALFDTEQEARDLANDHPFASAMGFDIYEVGAP